ncbi:mCG148038 [Mus musculus]|nr:mCG148038 [Mus musculus]
MIIVEFWGFCLLASRNRLYCLSQASYTVFKASLSASSLPLPLLSFSSSDTYLCFHHHIFSLILTIITIMQGQQARVHAFNPSTWQAEAGGSLGSQLAWSTE